jgi:hypothetical protein
VSEPTAVEEEKANKELSKLLEVTDRLKKGEKVNVEVTAEDYNFAKQLLYTIMRRTLHLVERYTQYRVTEVMEAGIKLDMNVKYFDVGNGVAMQIELIPSEDNIIDFSTLHAMRRRIFFERETYSKRDRGFRHVSP